MNRRVGLSLYEVGPIEKKGNSMPLTQVDGKTIGYLVSWEESERGWGKRPDGYSLHASVEDFQGYMAEYKSRLPAKLPDEYSLPDSEPVAVVLSPALARRLDAEPSLRFWNSDLSVIVSPTGQRSVLEKKPVTVTFIDLCVAKKASPTDIETFIQKWKDGAAIEGETLEQYLGLSPQEYELYMSNQQAIYQIVYNRMPAAAT